jgi:membrane protein required for colicin V production
MSILDILLIIPLGYAAYKGFRKGFIVELFTLLALFVGIYAGIHLSDGVTRWMRDSLGWNSNLLPALSFTVLFLGLGAMVYFGGKAIEQVMKIAQMGTMNKLAGGVFSVLKMAFFLSLAILILESFDQDEELIPASEKKESLLFTPLAHVSKSTVPGMKNSLLVNSEEREDSSSNESE